MFITLKKKNPMPIHAIMWDGKQETIANILDMLDPLHYMVSCKPNQTRLYIAALNGRFQIIIRLGQYVIKDLSAFHKLTSMRADELLKVYDVDDFDEFETVRIQRDIQLENLNA